MRAIFMLLFTLSASADVSFEFAIAGEKPFAGRARVFRETKTRGARLRLETRDVTIWSDGERVDVIDRAGKRHEHAAISRAGLVLLSRASRDVLTPFASGDWEEGFAAYKPRPAGTSTVRGVRCNVTELLIPNGGWRWHFGAEDRVLRREERLGKKEVVDYWNFAAAKPIGARPSPPKTFASRLFQPAGPPPGTAPEPWSVKTAGGETIASSALRGKVVVVDFWATWCAPCRASMPHLQKLFAEHRAQGLEVVGVTWREAGNATAYAEKNGIRYPIATSGNAAQAFGADAYGIPLVFVIGRDGRVVDFSAGYLGERTDRWLRDTVVKALRAPTSRRSSVSSPSTR